MATSSAFHYDRTQRIFHWSMAAIIFTAIALGITALYLDRNSPIKGSPLFVHKSLGITVLILVLARVAYRLIAGKPPYRQATPSIQRSRQHDGPLVALWTNDF